MKRLIAIILIAGSLFVGIQTHSSNAFTDTHSFVRTANYFLLSGEKLDDPVTVGKLARFDLIVIPLEAQVYNPTFFKTIRSLNKNIIILAYVPTVSWNDSFWPDPIHQKMYANIQPDWWLRDGNGNPVSVWPGTRALNLNSGWSNYLSSFVQNEVMSTGDWDGIFYDEVQDSISWVGHVDVNHDNIVDQPHDADQLWEQKYTNLFSNTRKAIGDKPILLTNGSSNAAFAPYVNGRMFESFPSSTDALSQWNNTTRQYLAEEKTVGYPAVNVVNVNTDNTGDKAHYQKVRFGITTTLLGNGYFGFDFGTKDHSQLWDYDEYHASLGSSKGDASSLNPSPRPSPATGEGDRIWQREFERGRVLVNATNDVQTIPLNGDFEKLHGVQDLKMNDGSIVSEVTLAARDGIILLRPIDEIVDATFRNGAFARIFNANGTVKRNGFFAYDNAFRGGVQITHIDYNRDGKRDVITADKTFVRVFDSSGNLHASFAPYGETYDKGVNIAVGDIEHDGSIEIVTGTLNGAGPQIRVFNPEGKLINPGFFAYDKTFRGGVNVALGDLNGDGIKEIITGPSALGGPQIRIFNKAGKLINPGFFAFDKTFRGGVNIASGDVDGDGIDDVISGMGAGGAPEVRVFNRNGKLKSDFFVGNKSQKNGVKIAASDLDGDGLAEIVALTTDVFTLNVFK